jgi:hypothetical protein
MGRHTVDPRAQALSDYLRSRAAAFSLSADSTDEHHIATAGMALLDAAMLAQSLPSSDGRLAALSRAGRFEVLPDGVHTFVETADLRAAVQRPVSGSTMSGAEILSVVITTACGS